MTYSVRRNRALDPRIERLRTEHDAALSALDERRQALERDYWSKIDAILFTMYVDQGLTTAQIAAKYGTKNMKTISDSLSRSGARDERRNRVGR